MEDAGNGGASDEATAGTDSSAADGAGVADNETMTYINQTYQRADAFLFGRRTYELFAGCWGAEERLRRVGRSGQPPDRSCLEHEAQVPRSPNRAGRTRPSSPVTSRLAIGELKAKPAGQLQVHGSGALIRWLLENDLVDEINLLIVPCRSSARARGCSPTPARTLRLTWSTCEPTRRA